jgi:hypothetical protein
MIEALAKTVESGLSKETLEKMPAETKSWKLPQEISRPGPDFKPPWKAEPSGSPRSDAPPLTDGEKKKIKEETGWPDEIIDHIATMEEYEIYKKAELTAVEINGKWFLVRNDIDWNQKDEFGRTNKERAEQGLAPIGNNGKSIELHHIGQNPNSPLAELTSDEHRGIENDNILHDKNKDSKIDRDEFKKERENHWKERAEQN